MQFEAKLTLDGLMTLFAGLIAFAAVIIQIRSSSGQLRDQIRAQRDADREEQERQKKAVATAILFEIDGFYRAYLRDPRDLLARIGSTKDSLPGIRLAVFNPFPVYVGNSSKIGELDVEKVQGVVHFYGVATSYLSILQDYKNSLERVDRAKFVSMTPRGSGDFSSLADEAEARLNLRHVKEALPELIKFTWLVCHKLCGFTDVKFEFPIIGVAAEQISIQDFTTSVGNNAP